MKKIVSKLLLSMVLGTMILFSQEIDSDIDGVIDSLDICPNTPFLTEVNAKGCAVSVILLPEDSKNDSWDININYGITNDLDMLNINKKHSVSIQTNYYREDWIYSVRMSGQYNNNNYVIKDSILKVKKRFKFKEYLKVYIGGAVRLPSYNYLGNHTDYTLYLSSTYYPVDKVSIFVGVNYTFINDEPLIAPLKDITNFYIGGGYFYNKDLYMNISYTSTQAKFKSSKTDNAIMSTVYYQISDKWFTSITYSHELYEKNMDNSINIHLGYNIW